MAQLRKTVSVATVLTEGRYEKTIPQDLWDLFIRQLAEIGKCSLHNYKLIPSSAITSGKDVHLTIFTDASTSQIISAYLTYNTDNGEKVSYQILGRSYLSNPTSTVHKCELQSLRLGSSVLRKLVSELTENLNSALLLTDSLVSVHWCLNNSEKLGVFVQNRTENICRNLKDAHAELTLLDSLARGPSDPHLDMLGWVSGREKTAIWAQNTTIMEKQVKTPQ
jgi:hypothetical protein